VLLFFVFLITLLVIIYLINIPKDQNPGMALWSLVEFGLFLIIIYFFNKFYPDLLWVFSVGIFIVLLNHWGDFITSIIIKYRDLIIYYLWILLEVLFILGEYFYDLLDFLFSALYISLYDLWRRIQYFSFFILNIFLVIYRRLRKK